MARRYDKEIREFLKVYQEELIENVCQLVRIPSVAGEKEGTHRYGVECAKALEFCMRLAKEKGLYAENFDDYGVEIRLYEKPRKKRLLLAAHTDVVPPSGENTYPPFGGTVDRGYIIGRGSVDDKGPLMALLYALFFFQRNGNQSGV